jgi:hypothetical protein
LKNIRKDTPATSHKILRYLMDHPDAKDTLEGIVGWWMLQQDIERNVAHIKKTVDELTVKGLLVQRLGRDRRKYYQVNRKKLPEISALVKE